MVIFFKYLAFFAILILIVGMIKPKWVLFWMKNPDRLMVSMIAMVLFMASWTMYSKLTLKPKPKVDMDKSSVEDRNQLQLNR